MSQESAAILLVHGDSDLLDALTRMLEARGLEVSIAATPMSALSMLESRGGDDSFAVIVAPWDRAGQVGAKLYRLAVQRHFALRDRFVFLGDETTGEFESLTRGLCLLLDERDHEEIARVVESGIDRARRVKESRSAIEELEWIDLDSPTLLLVDDEPLQLSFMVELFRGLGFSVTPAESGNSAIALLEKESYDVVLSDWYMPDGSGEDIFSWVSENRPEMLDRIFFISGHTGTELDAEAARVVILPKGQDSNLLVRTVIDAARRARGRF